jgi:outer membrane protein assembly factor BamB
VYVGWGDGNLYAVNPPATGAEGVLKWSFYTSGMLGVSAPALGTDGTVYVGTGGGNLFAISPPVSGKAGVLKWRYSTTDGSISAVAGVSAPALGADGTVYVSSHSLFAISPPASGTSGVLKWRFKKGEGGSSAPAIGADGTVYVGSADGNLYAIH